MTREEAIKYFKECNEKLVSVAKDENVYDYEKQVMEADCMRRTFESNEKAIKALQQEPCEDCIDRQRAIRLVKAKCNPYGKPTIDFESGKEVIKILKQMSPAKHETKSDVLDKIRDEIEAKCCITVGRENDPAITLYDVFEIIDKYRPESEV